MNDIVLLIGAYVMAVRSAVAALQSKLGTTSLLEAVRANRSLREGTLDSSTTYAFHGVGCRVTSGQETIDFDFGPGGLTGGFDAWRLWLFAEGDPLRFSKWQQRGPIEEALQQLEAQQMIEAPERQLGTHLYYLTQAGQKAIGAALGR